MVVFAVSAVSSVVLAVCCHAQDEELLCSEFSWAEITSSAPASVDDLVDFCGGVLSDVCGETIQQISYDLVLDAPTNVDLICSSERTGLCIIDGDCTRELGSRIGPQEVRLTGDFGSRQLKILIHPTEGNPFCDVGSTPNTVSCAGSFGEEDTGAPACYKLQRTRTPPEGGSSPTAQPSKSGECSGEGEYVRGEKIALTASPKSGWELKDWRGTDDDASTSVNNTATMPAEDHQVIAVYAEVKSSFDSSFEDEGFCDWADRSCNGCDEAACAISSGESSFPLGAYRTVEEGEHRGLLRGPEGADFDLLLYWWSGSEWQPVATGFSPHSMEEVVYSGGPGAYRWEVRSEEGSGLYELAIDYPGLARQEGNRLERSDDVVKHKKTSLMSIYEDGSKAKDFLVDTTPGRGGGEERYEMGFWIRPEPGLVIKGKKHRIVQVNQTAGGDKRVYEVFLRSLKGAAEQWAVAVQARTSSGGKVKLPAAQIQEGRWSQIGVLWEAGSDDEDGRIELHLGGVTVASEEFDNADLRVDEIRFGQVKGNKKKNRGVVYMDHFESSWGE